MNTEKTGLRFNYAVNYAVLPLLFACLLLTPVVLAESYSITATAAAAAAASSDSPSSSSVSVSTSSVSTASVSSASVSSSSDSSASPSNSDSSNAFVGSGTTTAPITAPINQNVGSSDSTQTSSQAATGNQFASASSACANSDSALCAAANAKLSSLSAISALSTASDVDDGNNSARVLPGNRNANEPSTPYFCSVSPVYKRLAVSEEAQFAVQCFDMTGTAHPIACPPNIGWLSDVGTVLPSSIEPTTARFVAGSDTKNGEILAYMEFRPGTQMVSCKATIEVYSDAEGCLIEPREATVVEDEQKTFAVTCFTTKPVALDSIPPQWNAREVPCPDLAWRTDAGELSGNNAGATLTAKNVGSGKYLKARHTRRSAIPEDYFECAAVVNVEAKIVASPTPTPTPTPGQGGNGGGTGPGGWNIYYGRGTGGNPLPSPTPTAELPPVAPSPSPSPRPTMGHFVLYPVTSTPTPTPSIVAGASGLTGLFTAQFAPLALGLLLGIIAVALLWYWLAGGKKDEAKNEAKNEKQAKK